MKSKVVIVGLEYEFECLEVGRSKSFPGAGCIKATAIWRMSKNRYKVYVIMDQNVVDVASKTIVAAVEYLQKMYDKYGKIPVEGDFQGGKDEERECDVT